MEFKSPLSQRIILSFVLLTGFVSGLFALGLTATIHIVEESLVTTELERDFSRILDDYKKGGDLRLDEGSAFFTAGPTLPDYLRTVVPGYTEIVLEDQAFYVYHAREGETSYFLVKDQTAFEKAEKLLNTAVFIGFVLSLIVSFFLGLFTVKQVIAPVRRLTRQVADRDQLRDGLPALSSEYPDDEVGALANAFDATITKLQQALQRETLFTSDVSHELRTPLMVINSSCDILIAKDGLDEYTRQKIESIGKGANEIKELVEAFLALARGKDSHPEMSTLHAMVNSEFQEWKRLASEKGNILTLQGESECLDRSEGKYPSTLLRTVLGNLIRNAIHHTTGGHIVLVLRPCGFDLRDTGSGISVDQRSHVFKPYHRGSASHRDGLGLGLSLVQRICQREGWTVTLEENQPSGCCFRIDFV